MLKKLYQIYSLVESRMLYQRELLNITKHIRADKICTDQQKTEIREFLTTILIDPKPVWAESELDVFVKTFNNATLNDFKRYITE